MNKEFMVWFRSGFEKELYGDFLCFLAIIVVSGCDLQWLSSVLRRMKVVYDVLYTLSIIISRWLGLCKVGFPNHIDFTNMYATCVKLGLPQIF